MFVLQVVGFVVEENECWRRGERTDGKRSRMTHKVGTMGRGRGDEQGDVRLAAVGRWLVIK